MQEHLNSQRGFGTGRILDSVHQKRISYVQVPPRHPNPQPPIQAHHHVFVVVLQPKLSKRRKAAVSTAARCRWRFHSAASKEQEGVGRHGRDVAHKHAGGFHALQVDQVLRAEVGEGHLIEKKKKKTRKSDMIRDKFDARETRLEK